MGKVKKRYFMARTGTIVEKAKEALLMRRSSYEEYKKIAKEIGADTSHFAISKNQLTGFVFKENAPASFKRSGSGSHYPKLNTKEGKKLDRRIKDIKTKPDTHLLEFIGIDPNYFIVSGNVMYFPSVTIIPNEESPVCLIQVPFDGKIKSLNEWVKPWNIGEVKSWELQKTIEEYNDSLEKK